METGTTNITIDRDFAAISVGPNDRLVIALPAHTTDDHLRVTAAQCDIVFGRDDDGNPRWLVIRDAQLGVLRG